MTSPSIVTSFAAGSIASAKTRLMAAVATVMHSPAISMWSFISSYLLVGTMWSEGLEFQAPPACLPRAVKSERYCSGFFEGLAHRAQENVERERFVEKCLPGAVEVVSRGRPGGVARDVEHLHLG